MSVKVPGEVSCQACSGKRRQQDDSKQHLHRTGPQFAVGQNRGVRFTQCFPNCIVYIQLLGLNDLFDASCGTV